jgi:hypothetical protein
VPQDSNDYEDSSHDNDKYSDAQNSSDDAPLDHSPFAVFDSPGAYYRRKLDGSKFVDIDSEDNVQNRSTFGARATRLAPATTISLVRPVTPFRDNSSILRHI